MPGKSQSKNIQTLKSDDTFLCFGVFIVSKQIKQFLFMPFILPLLILGIEAYYICLQVVTQNIVNTIELD